ncbi:MAG: aspartate-semialdehyde dehydrogenase [Alphaproteobacteria bacterium]|nr:MAG: aspartate-semialdehyde dehydrogenase [Alphaproteobacteria bacterium]
MFTVAVLGASGLMGRAILDILHERNFPMKKLILLGRENGAITIKEQVLNCIPVENFDFTKVDIVFNATNKEVILKYLSAIVEANTILIDKSDALRLDKSIPLVVSEVNYASAVSKTDKIVSSPNCVALPLAIVLQAMLYKTKIEEIFVTTFQSASGAGHRGTKALLEEAKKSFMSTNVSPAYFDKRIAFDILPKIGDINQNSSSTEELKVMSELNKILPHKIKINITCTRVPVLVGHAIDLKLKCNLSKEQIVSALKSMDIIHVCDRDDTYITQRESVSEDKIFISRIRKIGDVCSMWISYDNIRLGGALNGVKIAEKLLHLDN